MAKKKLKTVKAIAKRIRRTKKGKGKLKLRTAGQAHFNARTSSKKMRQKKNDKSTTKGNKKNINRVA